MVTVARRIDITSGPYAVSSPSLVRELIASRWAYLWSRQFEALVAATATTIVCALLS